MHRTNQLPCWALLVYVLAIGPAAGAANFTTESDCAVKFGVHEIVLQGDGATGNPFDKVAMVTFMPPSGAEHAKTVYAFYDGEDTWRARVYVSEAGNWRWSSVCATDKRLDGRSGEFPSTDSKLRGRLLPHPKNPRQWMTENGRWFLNLVDTAYFLLSPRDYSRQPVPEEDFQAYVSDAVNHGVTTFMTTLLTSPEAASDEQRLTKTYFADAGLTRLRLDNFRFADQRLRWLLDHYPDTALELILFPRGAGYGADERLWRKLTAAQKERILRYVVSRYAAYPQAFWLVVNDTHYGEKFPHNNAFAREVGAYFKRHDPWRHPLSTGHARKVDFYFGGEDWATYLHLEDAYALGAECCAKYHRFAKPVLLGEDRYEQDHPNRLDPIDMRYYQRRLYWAWLLSGGSASYGGRWWVLHPYTQTGERATPNPRPAAKFTHNTALHGLDCVKFIRDYFETRQIELSDFEPDEALARDPDGGQGARVPKLLRRGHDEFLIYHPNAAADAREAKPNTERKARLHLDLRQAAGPFEVEWYRADDGMSQAGELIAGGKQVELIAPWPGYDVVLRLFRNAHVRSGAPSLRDPLVPVD